MNILFIHQNYPGQYREIVPALAKSGKHRIVFLTQRDSGYTKPTDHMVLVYKPKAKVADDANPYTRYFEQCCITAAAAADGCREIKRKGFKPDIIVGHAGWGELLFVKEVWPDVPLVGCFEYYFIPKGGAVGHDPEFRERHDIAQLLIARNAVHHLNHLKCDIGHTATHWQRSVHPKLLQDKIHVLHEGIRTDLLIPDHTTPLTFTHPGATFTRDTELVTYLARNLEPVRGFHIMMRALPEIQKARPNAHIAVVGADQVSYGGKLAGGKTYRQHMTDELKDKVDWSRVHFLGNLSYRDYVTLMLLSRVHVYLTVPFVPSWSALEAMAMGKVIIASDVPPVREITADGRAAILNDFFDIPGLAAKVIDVLERPGHYADQGRVARDHVVKEYDFASRRFPEFLAFLSRALPKGMAITA
jgi:glycosyltransferase involved in cell wall biosynthesis